MRGAERVAKISAAAFIAAETVLAVLVQTVGGRANSIISFCAVALAFLFASLFPQRRATYLLTQAALLFTVLSDLFLVVVDPPKRLLAMIFFSVVQIAYFLRIMLECEEKRLRNIHLSVRLALLAVMLVATFAVLGGGADALAVVSVLYFTNLVLNAVFAFISFGRAPLLAVGLLLFVLCDVFVGFSMLDGYLPVVEGTLAYALAHPGFNAAWLFYVPAQTLLALSAIKRQEK